MSVLREWAAEFNIPLAYIINLEQRFGVGVNHDVVTDGKSEAHAQSLVMLEAAEKDVLMMRNNNGAFEDKTGRWVRFGLMNDSEKLNKVIKSSDLVGARKRLITQADVGRVIGQMVLREMKKPGWFYSGTEEEAAQLKFLLLMDSYGCDAEFATGPGTL